MAERPPLREVYVVSDLHVGGRYPSGDRPGDRGFRMCTRRGVDALTAFVAGLAAKASAGADVELVINGDFVDFLAEEREGEARFVPFEPSEELAVGLLERIVAQDRPLFEALAELVARKGALTLLLGNHDVELSLPAVRRRLESFLGTGPGARARFFYDGEAYVVGDAIIEHGNRYDGFNVIDHDALRRMRSLLSRRQSVGPDDCFAPPPGSRLVASIMNPIKEQYPFVDLLKPEVEAVVPILLALEPGFRGRALELLRLRREALRHDPIEPARPAYGGDIAAGGTDELAAALSGIMPADAAAMFAAAVAPPVAGDIAAGDMGRALGILSLLAAKKADVVETRLEALLAAVRVVQKDRSFDRTHETVPAYLDAARALADGGFRYVVFGHTHLAKRVALGQDRFYLNTGTWADLIEFPVSIVTENNTGALAELRAFVDDLARGNLDRWISFHPTYVRLAVRGDRVEEAELAEYDASGHG